MPRSSAGPATLVRSSPCSTRLPTPPAGTCRHRSADARDTTTCLVADRFGNVVAATPSGWSGVVAGDTGVWLGSRLQSFNTWDDHPNVIVPGKRRASPSRPPSCSREAGPCWPSASPAATTRTR